MDLPCTAGDLAASGYRPTRVRDEIRRNLLARLRRGEPALPGMVGYDDTVGPEVVRALLSRHDLLLLGRRGQGKSRLLRSLASLLDERVPVIPGSELRDDPLAPVSAYGKDRAKAEGDRMPVAWIGRDERYVEKLATPDTSMADLIGDIDLMRHVRGAELASEGAIHFGLIPRANRGLFCMNELPDLAPRVQVGLFDLLQERDVQIRGHAVRFALDLCFLFSANPEDYTSRGKIVTPLKDRIGSVVRTHYPRSRAEGVEVARREAWTDRDGARVRVPDFLAEIVEEIVRLARVHPDIDPRSGVSVRLSVSARELLASAAEVRAMASGGEAVARVCDLAAVRAAARGKVELLLSDDDAAEEALIDELCRSAVEAVARERLDLTALREAVEWFSAGGKVSLTGAMTPAEVLARVKAVPMAVEGADEGERAAWAEFALEGLWAMGKVGRLEQEFRGS